MVQARLRRVPAGSWFGGVGFLAPLGTAELGNWEARGAGGLRTRHAAACPRWSPMALLTGSERRG